MVDLWSRSKSQPSHLTILLCILQRTYFIFYKEGFYSFLRIFSKAQIIQDSSKATQFKFINLKFFFTLVVENYRLSSFSVLMIFTRNKGANFSTTAKLQRQENTELCAAECDFNDIKLL